ncbi:HNH endonuclease [Oscillatoriales cyanobacterium LEGE 11467]|uniref:HNH endonuclease n=1 Tax=Zarconia navalis LEGE 11467 TaxID=1828826 RepID=A0A928Z5J2_9CYAN|nr:HNH endonuclease [Zarconia navalis]MBE9039367.1 HNH endonuclease [Zarconia navalis LEGE 11467]
MTAMNSRYPDNWTDIATAIKTSARWRCEKCGMACIQSGEDTSGLSRSDRAIRTLTVHHRNYQPEDNRPENLMALCTGCHLSYHQRRRGNVSPGQLELW